MYPLKEVNRYVERRVDAGFADRVMFGTKRTQSTRVPTQVRLANLRVEVDFAETLLRDVAEGRELGDTSTLLDPSVFETIRASK